ncbi:hypothetical protein B0H11DRAFT_1904295 [Mycena galericulata]|nr:hypothetical protein B0H11DRAFT_1904295 [Mycena galericulata]
MCLGILWLCGHRCWQYNPDLTALFPLCETWYTLPNYIEFFLRSLNHARIIAEATISSVSYCRTRGPDAYPFLIVCLRHSALDARPVVLKLQGYYGLTATEDCSTVTVSGVRQSVRSMVGRPYDVCHTMTCCRGSISNLLVLAELSTKWDGTRAVYPATLFSALETFCNGAVTSSTRRRPRAAPLPGAIAGEGRNAVLDAFLARQELMYQQMTGLGYGYSNLGVESGVGSRPPSEDIDTRSDMSAPSLGDH